MSPSGSKKKKRLIFNIQQVQSKNSCYTQVTPQATPLQSDGLPRDTSRFTISKQRKVGTATKTVSSAIQLGIPLNPLRDTPYGILRRLGMKLTSAALQIVCETTLHRAENEGPQSGNSVCEKCGRSV